jgi:hypothetical protein
VGPDRLATDGCSPDQVRLVLPVRRGRTRDRRVGCIDRPQRRHRDNESVLRILDTERKADEHIVLIMDGAGWHKSKALKLPDGIIPARRDDVAGQLQLFTFVPPGLVHEEDADLAAMRSDRVFHPLNKKGDCSLNGSRALGSFFS